MLGKRASFRKLFLRTLALALTKALPTTTTRNALRIQFSIKFSLLLLYGFTQGIWLIPTCIYRTAREQNDRYKQGRSAPGSICTNTDGYKRKSRHQTWRAGDLLVLVWSGKAFRSAWRPRTPYEVLGEFWEKELHGTWGGYWKERGITRFDDPYHFQL